MRRWCLAFALSLLVLVAEPAFATTTSQEVQYRSLVSGSNAFLNYDGGANTMSRSSRDWPIGLIFYNNAEIDRVKAFFQTAGFRRAGGIKYEGYKQAGRGRRRFDSDRGRKTECDEHSIDYHYRVYGPGSSDRFYEPGPWGYYVVASAHIDRFDGCGDERQAAYFGYSERVEGFIADVARLGGWGVQEDRVNLGNYERLRHDREDRAHRWENDGRATTIRVP